MLISPPFLPPRHKGETDDAYVRRAMQGDAPGNGAFPLSRRHQWDAGFHLSPALDAHVQALDVRAIADGVIVYVNPPTPHSDDLDHPLNYAGGWTDDGCMVLKHSTEIGEGDESAVEFYSVYQHLSWLPDALRAAKPGDNVWRKDVIGQAGRIAGQRNRFHFEIFADDTHVTRLMGARAEGDVPAQDGRTDACYGDIHFVLPAGVAY